MSRELAVLGQPAKPLAASRHAKEPARAELSTHYTVTLAPHSAVQFAAKPGKGEAGDHGGLLTFHTAKAGRYRISLTTPHRIEVLDGANLVVSSDFQGHRDCEKVHKIVEFELSGNKDFTLQLSSGELATTGLAITAVSKTR